MLLNMSQFSLVKSVHPSGEVVQHNAMSKCIEKKKKVDQIQILALQPPGGEILEICLSFLIFSFLLYKMRI